MMRLVLQVPLQNEQPHRLLAASERGYTKLLELLAPCRYPITRCYPYFCRRGRGGMILKVNSQPFYSTLDRYRCLCTLIR